MALAAVMEQPSVLVRSAALNSVMSILVAAGFGVGPVTQRLPSIPAESRAAGMWILRKPGEAVDAGGLPYAIRFDSEGGIFIDIRIATTSDSSSPLSVEASCGGFTVLSEGGMVRHCMVGMLPLVLDECRVAESSTWS